MNWFFKNIDLFKKFSEIEMIALDRVSTMINFDRHQIIKSDHDCVFIVKNGRLKLSEPPNEKGEKPTITAISKGEFFGIVPHGETQTTFEVLEPLDALILDRYQFGLIIKKSGDLFQKHRPFFQRQSIKIELRKMIARSISSRLAVLLIELAEIENLPISTISHLIGADFEICEDIINELEKREIIAKKWNKIEIKNRWELKKIADATRIEIELSPDEITEESLFAPSDPDADLQTKR